jgi:hypothetical protein
MILLSKKLSKDQDKELITEQYEGCQGHAAQKIAEKVSYLCEIRTKGHKTKFRSRTKPVQVFKERPIMLHKYSP